MHNQGKSQKYSRTNEAVGTDNELPDINTLAEAGTNDPLTTLVTKILDPPWLK